MEVPFRFDHRPKDGDSEVWLVQSDGPGPAPRGEERWVHLFLAAMSERKRQGPHSRPGIIMKKLFKFKVSMEICSFKVSHNLSLERDNSIKSELIHRYRQGYCPLVCSRGEI